MTRAAVFALFLLLPRLAHPAELHDATAVSDFEKRVSVYAKLRSGVQSDLPPLKTTDSPEKIALEQRNLADAIRAARRDARQGDIFTPPIAAEFRRLIALAIGADGKRIRASLHHAEPVQLRLHVNDSYPVNIPLQSTPPTLLANLPRLPRQIEYRFAGRDLILLDVKANLVIDLLEDAIAAR